MPRPLPPPTPGSSTDIRGKEPRSNAPAFNLPPTAFQEAELDRSTSSTPSANGSDSSYRPVSPSSPADTTRKRPVSQVDAGTGVITKDDFSLPPPPTRSRKIIQMQPVQQTEQHPPPVAANVTPAAPKSAGKKKQGGGQTAAGRKIARKTAHSLIERRRRSKMNEEFGVLKDMIPACKGQEMHKLAILQASIDYLRYLEQCIADLQAQQSAAAQTRPAPPSATPSQAARDVDYDEDQDEEMSEAEANNDEEEDDDDDQAASTTPHTVTIEESPSLISLPSLSQISSTLPSMSPSNLSTGGGGSSRHYSVSSASQPSYSPYIHSNTVSPAFGPQLHHVGSASGHVGGGGGGSGTFSNLTSPALKPLDSSSGLLSPSSSRFFNKQQQQQQQQQENRESGGERSRSQHDLDQEATAALLMLNHDRRSWRPSTTSSRHEGRTASGISVKDLLSG